MAQTSVVQPATDAGASLRIGRVFGRSFETLSRHFLLFFVLSAIPTSPYLFLWALGSDTAPSSSQLIAAGLLLIFTGLLTPVIQAIILYGAFQDMRGKAFGFGESLKKGLSRFFPIIGLGICEMFLFLIGAILLLVPMFIFITMFFVATPACVIEKAGPIESLKRSAALTKGYRWKIFGIALLLALASIIVGAVIGAVFAFVGSILVLAIVRFLWQAAFGAFGSIVVAVLYHDLRASREGIDIEKMAAVFD